MALIRLSRRGSNFRLMMHALKNTPSLVIDCANCANPHIFYPYVSPEAFENTYVVPVDAIFRFRDTLKRAGAMAERLGAKTIVITAFDRLFSYDDEQENRDITVHAWEIIRKLAEHFDVVVGK